MLYHSYMSHSRRSSASSEKSNDSVSKSKQPKPNKTKTIKNPDPNQNIDYAKYGKGIISQKDVKLYYTTFNKYDQTKKGSLTIIEIQKLIKEGGLALNLATVQHIFRQIKSLKKTGVSFEDLMEMMILKDNEVESDEDYRKIFAYYDRQKKGYFQYQTYSQLWGTTKQKLPQNQIRKAFELMDSDKDGKVTYQDFVKAMRK